MKISVSWVKDFLPSFSFDTSALVEKLTFLGFEVEEVQVSSLPDDLVVVGKIEDVMPHPNAERLTICRVDVGREEALQIVCGAPNVKADMLVPVATEKAKLHLSGGQTLTIKASKIRGERSFGMICAADELGLSDDHSGVMQLDPSCRIGEPLARYLDGDVVLDIAVTPNRPDVLSHLGMARELSGGDEINYPEQYPVVFSKSGTLVDVLDSVACPYYTGVVIRGIKVAESPAWLRKKLESIGLRPKNNIVDITNYVLHGLGQPLHAFDLGKLSGERVVVRCDMRGEFIAINQQLCQVEPGMPVICDSQKPVALAGVMGGYDSAVSDATTDILLESAWFDPSMIRKSAKKASISSDASYRYERGIDPLNVRRSAECAVALILELAGGRVGEAQEWGYVEDSLRKVTLRPERVNALLGSSIGASEMSEMLERIGFSVDRTSEELLTFEVPSCRVDVSEEIDLVEEIARLYGYDNIQPSSQMATIYPQSRNYPEFFPDFLRSLLIGLNFREILTNPLLKREEAGLFSDRLVGVLNPISEGLEVLRPGLVPGFLKVISHNIRHGNRDLKVFEVARGFQSVSEDERCGEGSLNAYREQEYLVMAVTGSRFPRIWNQLPEKVDFYDLMGAVEMLLEKLNLLDKSTVNIYNENTVSIDVKLTEKGETRSYRVGVVQQLGSGLLGKFDIGQDIYIAEIDAAVLECCFNPDVTYEPPSRFPAVQRDISLILPQNVTVQSLVELVGSSDSLIRGVSVFDLFERTIEEGGERSVALSLEIADHTGTLQDERISDILSKVGSNAESKLGAVIRQV
ncbi:MAG: phenylalanine--tRNA ligase subunit beta [Chlorobiaceae bacterium]|jgi:phenylalanyl-tRNA synthetase beta chain|nr:phenylalanine--tRNA ligase subunit beta [Chlorobiaceae bacterium]NTV16014.1 phenylalanine--tRNA ligase subunit beta [Chlorobiaceae bacterium]